MTDLKQYYTPMKFGTIAMPTPILVIDNKGEVEINWNEVEKKASEYRNGVQNEINVSWCYVLMKLKEQK
jgi:hypothetical protein